MLDVARRIMGTGLPASASRRERMAWGLWLASVVAYLTAVVLAIIAILHDPVEHLLASQIVLFFVAIVLPGLPAKWQLAGGAAVVAALVVLVVGLAPNVWMVATPCILARRPPRWVLWLAKLVAIPFLAVAWCLGLALEVSADGPLRWWACAAGWWVAAITLSVLALWTYRRDPPQ